MAWGIFKKIARGLQKGVKWVNDKIVKPIVKPVLNVASDFIPGGQILMKAINIGSNLVDGDYEPAVEYAKTRSGVRYRKG